MSWPRLSLAFIFMGLSLALAPIARAQPSDRIRAEMAEMAKAVSNFLRERDEAAVTLGLFSGPTDCTGGPSLAHVLADELRGRKVEVRADARFQVRGEFRPFKDSTSQQVLVKVLARVETSNGRKEIDLETRVIFGLEELNALCGVTADLTQSDNLNVILAKSLEEPQVHIASGKAAASRDSPYGMAIEVKQPDGQYRLRSAEVKSGLAFVDLQRADRFGIRLYNHSPHEAAVRLTLDGLDLFLFAEGARQTAPAPYTAILIPPRKSVLVRGWPVTRTRSDEFAITAYARSAAGQLQVAQGLGTITAQFSAAWAKGTPAPPDEKNLSSRSARPDLIGRGDPLEVNLKPVERQIGGIRAAVSIRYSRTTDNQPSK